MQQGPAPAGRPVPLRPLDPDNNQHFPNENLRVLDFRRGIGIIAAVLAEPLP